MEQTMTKEQRFLIQNRVQRLIRFVIQDLEVPILEAFDIVYNSQLYERLVDLETGMYYQSAVHLYSYLKRELKTGTLA
ncbi:MAG: hypothetical protein LBN29_14690 [Mediterranea sp.]|jgi:hypothetical protein|nr:hypothetical protein [Mediterranea sp.]